MNKNIKFAFFGSDDFSIITLKEIIQNGFVPETVITVPDKPKGRKKIITPTPLKSWAIKNNLNVLTPEKLKQKDFLKTIKKFDLDIFVVSSYGKIIPEELLSVPKVGVLNVHPSKLPLWRGPTPIEHTILNDDMAGVTIIELDKKMDHGPILEQKQFPIENPDLNPPSYSELEEKLAKAGGQMISSLVEKYVAGSLTIKNQDHGAATFSKILEKEDGRIDLNDNPYKNIRKIRAFEKWPGTFFVHNKNGMDIRIKITKAHIENDELVLDKVIPEGKNEMDFKSFQNGYMK